MLNPYHKYRDSGVSWLGEVPEHWEVRRLKQCVAHFFAGGTPDSGTPIFYAEPGYGVSWLTIADMTNQRRIRHTLKDITEEGRKSRNLEVLPRGTLLYSMYASLGAVSILEVDATINQAIIGIRTLESILESEFALFFLDILRPHLMPLSSASTQANLNAEKVRSLPIFLPPIIEQAAIVRFLNYYDLRIGRYIRGKQKLIKLLEEQKQAIIHRAVTRGLDPSVRLKPSGVEWLGDVPEHWEIVRNGRLFIQRNETGYSELPILEVSLRTGVSLRDFGSSDRKQIMNDRDKYKRAAKGDIAYNIPHFALTV
jgi:restriction endonuclease S subunit